MKPNELCNRRPDPIVHPGIGLGETILTFGQAARRLPRRRNDRPTNPATIWRWAHRGLRGVQLEVTKIGATWCTSVEALERFFQALTAQARASREPVTKHSADTENILKNAGLLDHEYDASARSGRTEKR